MDLVPIAQAVARDLRRFDLREQERLIAEWIVELTFASGRAAVRIPRLAWLEDLTGIDRADISRAVHALIAMRILATDDTQDGIRYRILPDANFWQARPRLSAEELNRALEAIAQNNRQQDLLAPAPTLSDAIAETSLEAAASVQLSQNQPLGNSQHPTVGKFPTLGNSQRTNPCKSTLGNSQHPPLTKLLSTKSEVHQLQSSVTDELSTEKSAEGRLDLDAETQRLACCRDIFDKETMATWGALWRTRARKHPAKFDRVISAVRADVREGKPIKNTGGYANDLWHRFAD